MLDICPSPSILVTERFVHANSLVAARDRTEKVVDRVKRKAPTQGSGYARLLHAIARRVFSTMRAAALLVALVPAIIRAASVPARAIPRVIQGGMGARISSWKLARAVASRGEARARTGSYTHLHAALGACAPASLDRLRSCRLTRSHPARQLGITSGVAMDVIMVRELQQGDPAGIWRRALAGGGARRGGGV